jgi:catechol 2,3-dioxygenase-like lactoylglutathione lyase family enzyme
MATLTSSRVKKMSPQLLVSDIERSVAFYTKKLGFGLDFIYEDFYAGIIRDGFTIHLKSAEGLERRRKEDANNENPEIVFSVEGVEALYNEFVNNSVHITQSLRIQPYGKEFYVADPDGNILAFMEEP